MALSGAAFTAELISVLTSAGMVGTDLASFCGAIGVGSVNSIVGKSFATADTGSIAAAGVGTGVGITGVLKPTIVAAMLVEALSQGFTPTPDSQATYEAIADALINQLALATLNSTHTPVFVGTGTIVPGSIAVDASSWKSNIANAGIGFGLLGDDWPKFAQVVAAGCVAGMATGTGSVIITGAPPPTPSPGTGSGMGIIT